MDKYRIKRRTAEYRDDARGVELRLEEVSGKRAMSLASALADATDGSEGGKVENEKAMGLFVLYLSVSIVEADGSRPLDSDEGRAMIADWPLDVLTSAGQVAIDLNTPPALAKN